MPCNHVKIFSGKPTFQDQPLPPKFEWICRLCLEAGYQDRLVSGHANPDDDDYVSQDLFAQLKPLARHPDPQPDAGHYTYQIAWSKEDRSFMGTCLEFPSLSWLDKDQEAALRGIRKLVVDCLTDMKKNGEALPTL